MLNVINEKHFNVMSRNIFVKEISELLIFGWLRAAIFRTPLLTLIAHCGSHGTAAGASANTAMSPQ